jgi:sulfur relay (sulfurtransferase) DsrF/TusC family protein
MENAMNRDILMVVRHGPYGGFQAAEALRHANGSLSLGFRPIVVLVDDGVYLAQADQEPGQSEWLSLGATLEEIIARGLYEKKDSPAEFYVDSDSLHQRGITLEDLVEGLEPIEHEKIADLMASHRLQLIF